MIARFFRAFFWAVLAASIVTYAYLGVVVAGAGEAVLIEDVYTGFEPDVVEPGQVRFVPARGLPGRVRLHRVRLGPRILRLKFRRGLRESVVLGLDETFFVHVHLRLTYSLELDRLRPLFRQLDDGDWTHLRALLAKKMDYFLRRKLDEFYQRDADIPRLEPRLLVYLNGPLVEEANEYLRRDGVVLNGLLVERLYVPDATRYRAMVAAGGEILNQKVDRIKIIDTARARAESQRITDRAYFARLEKMGVLLRRHPQLREYLAVDRLGDQVEVLVMPSERWFGSGSRSPARIPVRPPQNQTVRPRTTPNAPTAPALQTPAPRRRARDFIDLTPP